MTLNINIAVADSKTLEPLEVIGCTSNDNYFTVFVENSSNKQFRDLSNAFSAAKANLATLYLPYLAMSFDHDIIKNATDIFVCDDLSFSQDHLYKICSRLRQEKASNEPPTQQENYKPYLVDISHHFKPKPAEKTKPSFIDKTKAFNPVKPNGHKFNKINRYSYES